MRHGTRWCYANGCRHPECVTAEKRYQYERETGRRLSGLEPASNVAEVIASLRSDGWTWRELSEETGLTTRCLQFAVKRREGFVQADTAAVVLALAERMVRA